MQLFVLLVPLVADRLLDFLPLLHDGGGDDDNGGVCTVQGRLGGSRNRANLPDIEHYTTNTSEHLCLHRLVEVPGTRAKIT